MMLAIDIERFLSGLPPGQRRDPLIRELVNLCDATSRAEKISDPGTWTQAPPVAYAIGDTATFSRLRGYSESEIKQYLRSLQCAVEIDERYGEDTAITISYEVSCAAGLNLS